MAKGRILRLVASAVAALLVAGLATQCGVVYGAAEGAPPGLTADTIRVGFVVVDLGRTKDLLGFKTPDQGDPRAQVAALTEHINATGGIAGRRLEPVIRAFEASSDSPQTEEQLCNAFTQDDQVFAVVLAGQLQPNARECYARHRTLVLDITLVPQDEATYRRLAPYLWTPSYPTYDDATRALFAALDTVAYFDSNTRLGIVAADTPVNRTAYESIVEPELRTRTGTPRVAWIDTLNVGTLGAGLNQAAVDFASVGVNHVMFLGGARLAPFFMTAAAAHRFTARYAVTTFDNPTFLVENPDTVPAAALKDSVGIGFQPAVDVPDSAIALSSLRGETECLRVFSAKGIGFGTRATARTALLYCDAVRLLQLGAAGARAAGVPLSARTWADAAQRLGSEYSAANALASSLGAGRYAPAAAYRVLAYESSCKCYLYRGGDESFER